MNKILTVLPILIFSMVFCVNAYPTRWSDDFRITYGCEKGGAGRDICFFDMSQDGDYFFVVHDGGRDYTFLTRISNEGNFVVKEKQLIKQIPKYVFFDANCKLHVFYSPAIYPSEIAYLQFDENGNKLINTTFISDVDWMHSSKVIAGTDNGGNIAIFWLEENATSPGKSNIMFKKVDSEAKTLNNTESLLTIDVDPLNWALKLWTSFDEYGNLYFLWREEENHTYYYYFVKFDTDGNILRDKTFIWSRLEQYAPQAWDYDQLVVGLDKIHLFTSQTEKKTTLEGKFIAMESYINYTQFQTDGSNVFEKKTIFSEVNGTIFNSLSVAMTTDQKIHLMWDDEIDYGPDTSPGPGYSHEQPREIYYLALNENGDPLHSTIRLTEVDQRNSRNPYTYAKMVDLFLVWSDNRYYESSDNLNGFDIFLKSTAQLNLTYLTIPFYVTVDGTIYPIEIVSNSTISHFDFNQSLKQISFNVTCRLDGTTGFCNITIPKSLLWGEFSLFMNDSPLVESVDYAKTYNGTHYTFHITYIHSTYKIEVIGTNVVPEFPSFLILPLFMIATLLAVIVYRRIRISSKMK